MKSLLVFGVLIALTALTAACGTVGTGSIASASEPDSSTESSSDGGSDSSTASSSDGGADSSTASGSDAGTIVTFSSSAVGSSVLICGSRTPPADSKYRCISDAGCPCFNIAADGGISNSSGQPAVFQGLCPSSDVSTDDAGSVDAEPEWTFTYSFFDDAGCMGSQLNGDGGTFTCFDTNDLTTEAHPNQSVEFLDAGLNENFVLCEQNCLPCTPVEPFNPLINPLTGQNNFLTVVHGNCTVVTADMEGTLACGGNLIVGQTTFPVNAINANRPTLPNFLAPGDSVATALLVGGTFDVADSLTGGIVSVMGSVLMHIGVQDNLQVFNEGTPASTFVVSGTVSSPNSGTTPQARTNLVAQPSTSPMTTSVFDTGWMQELNFDSLFATFEDRSTQLATCTQNVFLINVATGMPIVEPLSALTLTTLTLTPGITNVLNISFANDLNFIQNISYSPIPSANTPVLINVTTPGGTLNWTRVATDNLPSDSQGAFILYNFPGATVINQMPGCFSAGGAVRGTIYAPTANLIDMCPSNNVGNVVVDQYIQGELGNSASGGEVHNSPFVPTISCPCPACVTAVVNP